MFKSLLENKKTKNNGTQLNTNTNGFTLIELLLVVVLISVLSGLIISAINVNALRSRSRDAQRASDLKRIQTALELYFSDYRGYPSSGSFQNASTVLNTALTGAYIQVIPTDPRNGEALASSQCSQNAYRYYYRADVGSGMASRYVLFAIMENANSVGTNACNSLSNCSGSPAAVAGCNACAAPCYGVQNPL